MPPFRSPERVEERGLVARRRRDRSTRHCVLDSSARAPHRGAVGGNPNCDTATDDEDVARLLAELALDALDRHEEALHYYRRFVTRWQDADPHLQPQELSFRAPSMHFPKRTLPPVGDLHVRSVDIQQNFVRNRVRNYYSVSISGYHIREAGSTAAEELAFTLANGFAYVELALEAGLPIDAFAPRLSFFFNSHIDFFEEIGKFRAARRIWARWMKERYGATDERAMLCRFHSQTAGVSLTAQQPEINIARVAIQAEVAAGLPKAEMVGTSAWLYFVINLSKIPLYLALGGGWENHGDDSFVDPETREEMMERTDWGDLLE